MPCLGSHSKEVQRWTCAWLAASGGQASSCCAARGLGEARWETAGLSRQQGGPLTRMPTPEAQLCCFCRHGLVSSQPLGWPLEGQEPEGGREAPLRALCGARMESQDPWATSAGGWGVGEGAQQPLNLGCRALSCSKTLGHLQKGVGAMSPTEASRGALLRWASPGVLTLGHGSQSAAGETHKWISESRFS